ncbi:hypothetical protein D3C75_1199670 [compost metagenome]
MGIPGWRQIRTESQSDQGAPLGVPAAHEGAHLLSRMQRTSLSFAGGEGRRKGWKASFLCPCAGHTD